MAKGSDRAAPSATRISAVKVCSWDFGEIMQSLMEIPLSVSCPSQGESRDQNAADKAVTYSINSVKGP